MYIGVCLINKITVIVTAMELITLAIEQKLHQLGEIATYLKKMDVLVEGQKYYIEKVTHYVLLHACLINKLKLKALMYSLFRIFTIRFFFLTDS